MNGQRIKKSPFLRGAWARYRKNTPALIGLVIIAAVILLAVFADVLAPYQETVLAQHPDQRFLGPSAEHLLGTDALGRDSFARLIHGARWSLAFGSLGAALEAFLLPWWYWLCRTVFLSIVGQSYIETARANGRTTGCALLRHVIPNALSILMIQYSTQVSAMVVAAAGFSYLGLGIQHPTPEWGSMLAEAQTYLRIYPNSVIWPGIVIVLINVALSLMGNGMSEALDP